MVHGVLLEGAAGETTPVNQPVTLRVAAGRRPQRPGHDGDDARDHRAERRSDQTHHSGRRAHPDRPGGVLMAAPPSSMCVARPPSSAGITTRRHYTRLRQTIRLATALRDLSAETGEGSAGLDPALLAGTSPRVARRFPECLPDACESGLLFLVERDGASWFDRGQGFEPERRCSPRRRLLQRARLRAVGARQRRAATTAPYRRARARSFGPALVARA